MPIYKYKAETSEGKIKKGRIVGMGESEVISRLRHKDLSPLYVADVTDTLEIKIELFLNSVKIKDLVIFSRQFSVMIDANVPVVESLIILIAQTKNISLQHMLSDIAFEVDSGSFLSDAFAKHPKAFSQFFVNIIRSGETSGKLGEVLLYLADEMEKNYDMVTKIRGAMIYPIFILTALVGVAIVLMIYVIPNLTLILTETNTQLPLSTRLVI